MHSRPGETLQGDGRYVLHGQDASTTSDVKYDLVLEEVLVLDDGVHIRAGADFIFLQRASGREKISRRS